MRWAWNGPRKRSLEYPNLFGFVVPSLSTILLLSLQDVCGREFWISYWCKSVLHLGFEMVLQIGNLEHRSTQNLWCIHSDAQDYLELLRKV